MVPARSPTDVMTEHHILAITALLGFVLVAVTLALRQAPAKSPGRWLPPAAVSLLFLGFTLYAIAGEGPTGFWPEHTRNRWGNQIWFDLLCAAGLAWALMLPRARQVGMHPLPWLAVLVSSGSIGALLMYARLSYLEARAEQPSGT